MFAAVVVLVVAAVVVLMVGTVVVLVITEVYVAYNKTNINTRQTSFPVEHDNVS